MYTIYKFQYSVLLLFKMIMNKMGINNTPCATFHQIVISVLLSNSGVPKGEGVSRNSGIYQKYVENY